MIVKDLSQTREIYSQCDEAGWVLPCFCSENLTTTEAVLAAADERGRLLGRPGVPVILALTCNYAHRRQAANYTHTRDWRTGLRLFTSDIEALAGPDGPYKSLRVMIHLDHLQHDADAELLEGDLSNYASIMYDASTLPLQDNMRKTARFVEARGKEILVEGACDEITDAEGNVHNEPTAPASAEAYFKKTGVDLVVANLGTEHRASAETLTYRGDIARRIRKRIGRRIVLHGASSATPEQLQKLSCDGVCKVNIWTCLERDSAPALLHAMAAHAARVAGGDFARHMHADGLLGERADLASQPSLQYFTAAYRQEIVFCEMKRIAGQYFDMWYR
jgi:fructose/tagatose bisphosphate aldolase